MILALLAASTFVSTPASVHGESLGESLALVPPEAIGVAVIADLRRTNQDLADMLAAMDRPAMILAGRPIEMAKAQLGVSVELDESGSFIAWYMPSGGDSGNPIPTFLLPTRDHQAFLEGNFTHEPESAANAWMTAEGDLLYARSLPKHVLLSPDPSMTRDYDPGDGSAGLIRARFGPEAQDHAADADMIAWFEGSVLDTFSQAPAEAVGGFDDRGPDFMNAITASVDEGLVIVDADPLGLSLRTFTRHDPLSTLGSMLEGGDSREAPMDRLPDASYYFAMSVDVAGLGGIERFKELLVVLGMSPDQLPGPLRDGTMSVTSMQMAAYPSRLGIALGGLLNDSSMVMVTPDPDELMALMRSAISGMEGERGGIRYKPNWIEDKPLRNGGTADAFQVKETVLPPSKDAPVEGAGDAAFMRMFMQLIYGSRGLSGFLGQEGDSVVMTFSQRPDVWERALAAAGRDGATLADNGTLKSMRSWLIERPDVEILLGVGTFGKLMEQMARTVPMIDPGMFPNIPQGTPPVAFDCAIDEGSMETATVIPTGVLALVMDQVMNQMMAPRGPGAEGGAPSP